MVYMSNSDIIFVVHHHQQTLIIMQQSSEQGITQPSDSKAIACDPVQELTYGREVML